MESEPDVERHQVEGEADEDPEAGAPDAILQLEEVARYRDDPQELPRAEEKLADASDDRRRRNFRTDL